MKPQVAVGLGSVDGFFEKRDALEGAPGKGIRVPERARDQRGGLSETPVPARAETALEQ